MLLKLSSRFKCIIEFFFVFAGEVAEKLMDVQPDVSVHSKQDHGSTSFPQTKPQTKTQTPQQSKWR